MLQLRRIKDTVIERGSDAVQNVGTGISRVTERGNGAARSAYDYVLNHRRATAAVVLGASAAAALIWLVQRNGGYSAVQKKVVRRVRHTTRSLQAQASR